MEHAANAARRDISPTRPSVPASTSCANKRSRQRTTCVTSEGTRPRRAWQRTSSRRFHLDPTRRFDRRAAGQRWPANQRTELPIGAGFIARHWALCVLDCENPRHCWRDWRGAADRGADVAGQPLRRMGCDVNRRRHQPRGRAVPPKHRPNARCTLRCRTVAGRHSRALATWAGLHPTRPTPR